MENILETIYAKDSKEKDPNCKTCKNKPKLLSSWTTWFGIWMFVMSVYGNFVLFKKIINFIF